jgi:hypothetical protein
MADESRNGELGAASGPGARPAAGRAAMSGSGDLEEKLPARARIISPSLLLPAEIVIFELKPSLWYAAFIGLPVLALGAAVAILAFAIHELPEGARHWGVVIGMWIMGLRVAIALLQWLGRTYVLTDRRVLKQHGVINVRVECMGLEDIETSFVAQSAFQKVLGIGTIFFRSGPEGPRCETHTWEHVRRPKEVHGHIVMQIDRWKRDLQMGPPKAGE